MLTALCFEHYKGADLLRSLMGSHCRRFCERQGKYDSRQHKQLEAKHFFHCVNRELFHLPSPLHFSLMGMAAAVTTRMTTPILWRVIVSLVIQMLPVKEIYDGAS